jgi:acetolactate synthase I/II/III large subunit
MKQPGAEIVLRALEDEEIPFTFGIPGTHNIELYDALAASEKIRPILVTDEQSASFMADAVWRASGRLGCVNVVPGAGLTHALSGIVEAYMDNVPMLVLACGIRRDTGMGFQLHDVDQGAIARPVTKAVLRPERGEEIYGAIRRACAIARNGVPGPVMVEIPANLYFFRHEPSFEAYRAEPAAGTPIAAAEIDRAAAVLGRAKRPLLYVGLGAAGAGADLTALAERLEAPVSTTFQGKGVFPESHPLFLWPGFGSAAPPFVRGVVRDCDATLAIGCRFGEVATGSYGAIPPGPLVHVDLSPEVLGRNYRAEVGIAGDAAAFVEALLSRLPARGQDPSLRAAIATGRAEVETALLAPSATGGVAPGLLFRALQRRFGPQTIFTTDSGNGTFLAIECLKLERSGQLLAPVDYSCMGYAIPAAIGAKLARPDAAVVALAGDGAFLMTGLELLTASQLGVPVVALVLRDGELAQISQFQDVALDRKVCSELPGYDLASLCRGVGVECLPLASESDIDAVLTRAATIVASGRPVALDVAIDYSRKTFFTRGVVATNLRRLPWRDRIRFVTRALARKVGGAIAGKG